MRASVLGLLAGGLALLALPILGVASPRVQNVAYVSRRHVAYHGHRGRYYGHRRVVAHRGYYYAPRRVVVHLGYAHRRVVVHGGYYYPRPVVVSRGYYYYPQRVVVHRHQGYVVGRYGGHRGYRHVTVHRHYNRHVAYRSYGHRHVAYRHTGRRVR
jgi:hypothetical protein